MKHLTLTCLLVLVAASLIAHPHFQKTMEATLPGDIKVSLSFYTVPANETHAENAAVGAFLSPGMPTIEIATATKSGSVSIPAGKYTVGAIKNSMTDWTMALSPGQLGRGETPDMSKLIKLESMFVKSAEGAPHLVVDVGAGHGKLDGKATLFIGFGSLFLSGAISDIAE